MFHKLLSICIPTYNRRDKLIRLANKLISDFFKYQEVEIVIYDNHSTDGTWEELNLLESDILSIYRQDKNVGFCRNLVDVINFAKGDFVFLISDDDLIEPEFIYKMLDKNILISKIGIIYGSIYRAYNEDYYQKFENNSYSGKEAIRAVALKHSYMSGILLNRNGIDFPLIYDLIKKEDKLFYPHEIMIFSILSKKYKTMTFSDICCYQGPPGKSFIIKESSYYFYKERIYLIRQYLKISKYFFKGSYLKEVKNSISKLAINILFDRREKIWGSKKIIRMYRRIYFFLNLSFSGIILYLHKNVLNRLF